MNSNRSKAVVKQEAKQPPNKIKMDLRKKEPPQKPGKASETPRPKQAANQIGRSKEKVATKKNIGHPQREDEPDYYDNQSEYIPHGMQHFPPGMEDGNMFIEDRMPHSVMKGGYYPEHGNQQGRRPGEHEQMKDDLINKLQTENRLFKTEIEDMNRMIEMLQTDKDNNLQRLRDGKNEREKREREMNQEITELNQKLNELQGSQSDQVQDLMRRVEKLKKEKQSLKSENDDLKTLLEDQENENRNEKEKREKELKREIKELKQKIHDLEESQNDQGALKQLEKQKHQLIQSENERLKALLERQALDENKPDMQQKFERLKEENKKLKRETEENLNQIAKLEKSKQKLKEKLQQQPNEGEDSNGKVENLTNKLQKKSKKLEEALRENEELKKKMYENNNRGDDREIENITQKLQKKSKKLEEALKENEELKNQILQLRSNEYGEKEIEQLTQKLQKKSKKLEEARRENEELKNHTYNQQPFKSEDERIEILENKLENKSKKLEKALKENAELKKNHLSLEREISNVEKLASALKYKHLVLQEPNKETHSSVTDRTNRPPEIDMLAQAIGVMRDEILKLKSEKKSEKEKLSDNLNPPDDALRDYISLQESQIKSLEKEVAILQNAMKEKEASPLLSHRYHPGPERSDQLVSHLMDGRPLMPMMEYPGPFMIAPPMTQVQPPQSNQISKELRDTRSELATSNKRVEQLEKWLDEIYNNKDFEIVPKEATENKTKYPGIALPKIGNPNSNYPNKLAMAKGYELDKKSKSGYFSSRA